MGTDLVALTLPTGTTLRVLVPDGATSRPTAPATTSVTCLRASARCALPISTALAWVPLSSLPSVLPTTLSACVSLTLTLISPIPLPELPVLRVWSTASPGARASTAPTVAVSIAVTLTIAVFSSRLLPPTRRSATRLLSATTSSSRPKSEEGGCYHDHCHCLWCWPDCPDRCCRWCPLLCQALPCFERCLPGQV